MTSLDIQIATSLKTQSALNSELIDTKKKFEKFNHGASYLSDDTKVGGKTWEKLKLQGLNPNNIDRNLRIED